MPFGNVRHERGSLRIISGARHLMRGYEAVAAGVVVHYIQRWAETPGV